MQHDGTVTTLAGGAVAAGTVDGIGAAARSRTPRGIVIDAAHNIYVSDAGSSRIRRISPLASVVTPVGSVVVCTDGATGTFRGPTGLALEQSGNLVVADTGNSAVRYVHRLITSAVVCQ